MGVEENPRGDVDGLMQIGELARRAGITVRAVRYYEQLGLISHRVRTKGGFRLYDDGELGKLEFIRDLQEFDFPLARIRHLFSGKREARCGADLAEGTRETLAAQLREMEARMARYQAVRAAILETLDMLRTCGECSLRPGPEVCCSCPMVRGRVAVPVPMRALIAVS